MKTTEFYTPINNVIVLTFNQSVSPKLRENIAFTVKSENPGMDVLIQVIQDDGSIYLREYTTRECANNYKELIKEIESL